MKNSSYPSKSTAKQPLVWNLIWNMALGIALAFGCLGCSGRAPQGEGKPTRVELLNVSYDPTRELYRDINSAFVSHYAKEHGTEVSIKQSHASSGANRGQ